MGWTKTCVGTMLLVGLGETCVLASEPAWEHLRDRPVVQIQIEAHDLFDLERIDKGRFFYSWANALHIRTRSRIIERELLLLPGDPFDPRLAGETERNLRGLGIFQDVRVEPEAVDEGVRLVVHTRDRWTTKLRTDFSIRGGIRRLTVGLEETNLLGHAIQIGGGFEASNDLDAGWVAWRDPRFVSTRWDVRYGFRRDDLERGHSARLAHPFFSETVRWSAEFTLDSRLGTRRIFDSSEEIERIHIDLDDYQGFVALHTEGHTLTRWGLLGWRRSIAGDVRQEIAALGLTASALRREFRKMSHLDLMGAGEDVATGWTLQLGLGADGKVLGADDGRPFYRTDAAWARFLTPRTLWGAALRHHAFYRDRDLENGRLTLETYGFWQTPRQTLAWRLGGAALLDEPRFLLFHVGGGDVLRGYEARHLSGTRLLYFNIEERLFTQKRLFFLRLGGTVFVDAVAVWDEDQPLGRHRARLGMGLGLRLGNNQSGGGVTAIDLAFGTGSVQVSMKSGSFFRIARGLEYASSLFLP